jgi:hypothetical protein
MRLNFRKIAAVASSLAMVGMTAGIAAAANYPAPFVSGGSANVAIVYGSGAAVTDQAAAQSIATSLSSFVTGGSISGESVSLDTSADRIWLNTSLNAVKSTLTSSDLPTVLADSDFSGNADAKLTSTIKFQAGAAAGGENSGKVIFARQPKTSNDPVVGISLGTSATSSPLYNASVTFSQAVNFSHTDSEGETVHLFGADFVVSTATDTDTLVLFKSAEETTLTVGGSNPSPTATVTVDGTPYTITLTNGDSTTAYLTINGDSKSITEGNSKKVGGVEVAVKDVVAGSDTIGTTATILVGAEKLTIEDGATVTSGSDNDPIDGTTAYIVGGPMATTELAVAVYRADSSNDAIVEGTSFEDPVFSSFQVYFSGLSSPLGDATREMITVENSGDDTMLVSFTDSDGNAGVVEFAHNQSTQWRLADESNHTINVREMANLTEDAYIVVGNEDYGHLLQLTQISNNTGTTPGDDRVKFQDVLSGTTYDTTFSTTEGSGTLTIDGKQYTVTFRGTGDTGWAQVKYPTSESANANTFVVFPTIQTQGGAQVVLYEPLTLNLANFDGGGSDLVTLRLPDGDGYTDTTLTYAGNATHGNWTISGAGTGTLQTGAVNTNVSLTIGTLTYRLETSIVATNNQTKLVLIDPEGTAIIDQPAALVFEGKDDDSAYHAILVDLETSPAGNSDNGVGVNDVLFSSDKYHTSASLQSDSDITHDIDWFGTLVVTDATESDQKTLTISVPSSQVYASIEVGESGGTTGGALGDVLVTDSEVSTVSSKNLVVVGGSCINTAAATLVGGNYCGSAWTTATGIGSGQFLIKGYSSSSLTSRMALLVAGWEAADTTNAATYLRTQSVDTSKEYKGISATSATLV